MKVTGLYFALIRLLKEDYKNPKIYLKTRQYSLEKRF